MHILYLYKYKFSICINTNLYLYLYRYKFVFQQLHHLLLLLYLLHSFVRQTKFSFQEDTRCLYLDVIPVTTFHAVFRIFCLRFTQNMFILYYLILSNPAPPSICLVFSPTATTLSVKALFSQSSFRKRRDVILKNEGGSNGE